MPENDGQQPTNKNAERQANIKAKVAGVRQQWAKERNEAELPRNPVPVRAGKGPGDRAGGPSERVRSNNSELFAELGNELKGLSSEMKNWRHESCRNLEDKSTADKRWRIIVTISVVATVILGIVALWLKMNQQADQVRAKVDVSQFVIASPPEGAEVGLGQKVRGRTPYPELNHYIVVSVVRTGLANVRPAFVDSEGTFNGEARFGDATVGEDEEFTIRAFATKATVSMGILNNTPDDTIWSNFVNVRRSLFSPVVGSQIVIAAPANGAEVAIEGTIAGKTLLPELNHYIVVTPKKSAIDFVQGKPVLINSADGSFNGRAMFGSGQVGLGEHFAVQVLATKSTLKAAPLANAPADAVFSNSVVVTRK